MVSMGAMTRLSRRSPRISGLFAVCARQCSSHDVIFGIPKFEAKSVKDSPRTQCQTGEPRSVDPAKEFYGSNEGILWQDSMDCITASQHEKKGLYVCDV